MHLFAPKNVCWSPLNTGLTVLIFCRLLVKVVFTAISMLYLVCVILMYSSPALREHIIYLNSCKSLSVLHIYVIIFSLVSQIFFRTVIRNPMITIRVNDLGYWEFFGLYFKRLKSWLYYYGNADILDSKVDLSSSFFLCFDFLVQL